MRKAVSQKEPSRIFMFKGKGERKTDYKGWREIVFGPARRE